MTSRSLLRRAALCALDGSFALVLAAFYLLCTPTTAQAYVDPSVVTYTIQALAGVAVALSAVFGVVWRRLRRKVFETFNIDENRDKLVEPAVHAVDPATPQGREALAEADRCASADAKLIGLDRPQNTRWALRFVMALLVVGSLVFTLGIVGPLETVASSLDSFPFGLMPVLMPIITFALVLWLVVSFAASLVPGKAFNVVVAVLAALSVLCVAQTLFMNKGLPTADGRDVPWQDFTKIALVTSLVWVAVIAAFVVWTRFNRGKSLRTGAVVLSLMVVLVGAASLWTSVSNAQNALNPGPGSASSKAAGGSVLTGRPLVTTEGMKSVSQGHNVIMFVLDAFDNGYMDEVLERYPDALDDFTGFTHYTDSSGIMIPTRFAMSTLLTGQTLDDSDERYDNDKITEWYTEGNLIDAMREQGYSAKVYASDVPQGLVPLTGRVDNIHKVQFTSPYWGAVTELWKCSLYRALPWVAKPAFWYYSGDVANALIGDAASLAFTLDDAQFLKDVRDDGLTLSETAESSPNGEFRLIHLMGPHYPITLNAEGERVSESETDAVDQARGSLRAVEAYLDQMRELGVYDDATIIVTADHGFWYLAKDIVGPTSPFLMIKPAEDAEQAAAPLKVSNAPVSQSDLPATIVKAMGGDYSAWGTPVEDVPEDQPRERTYYATSVNVDNNYKYEYIYEWKINGPVRDWHSWTKTGKSWVINP